MNEMLHSAIEFFSKFEPKDWVTLVASFFALTFSILTLRQKSGESRLELRKQLTELLEKITEFNIEVAKFRHLRNKNDEYPPNYIALLNDQRRFLVRQAAFVASRIKKLVSPYEYLLIAGGFGDIDDIYQAEYFYKIAAKAPDQRDRAIATRSYANYLAKQGRKDDARQNYSNAIECFKGDSDSLRLSRGDTYERWARWESEWSNETDSRSLLERAAAEYESLTNTAWRSNEGSRVRRLLSPPQEHEKEVGREDT